MCILTCIGGAQDLTIGSQTISTVFFGGILHTGIALFSGFLNTIAACDFPAQTFDTNISGFPVTCTVASIPAFGVAVIALLTLIKNEVAAFRSNKDAGFSRS